MINFRDKKNYSGQVIQRHWPDCRRFLVVFVNNKMTEAGEFIPLYLLMDFCGNAYDGELTAPGIQFRDNGSYLFTPADLDHFFRDTGPEHKSEVLPLRADYVPKGTDCFSCKVT